MLYFRKENPLHSEKLADLIKTFLEDYQSTNFRDYLSIIAQEISSSADYDLDIETLSGYILGYEDFEDDLEPAKSGLTKIRVLSVDGSFETAEVRTLLGQFADLLENKFPILKPKR